MSAWVLHAGVVHTGLGSRFPSPGTPGLTTTTITRTRANAAGTAQRGATRSRTSHTATTGSTSQGFETAARTGARQSVRSTPASIACATGVGMRAISRPIPGQTAVTVMSRPVTRNAPTAAGQPPTRPPVPTSSAAPGVDQAKVIGIRVRAETSTVARPMVTNSASSPDPAWVGVAPTARSPDSTTANELVEPTRAVTSPATTGRRWSVMVVSFKRSANRTLP